MRGAAPVDERIEERVASLSDEAARFAGCSRADVRVVRSPYRICPLGAHVDHQLGRVTGLAIDRSILLAFCPTEDASVRLMSRDFGGALEFGLSDARSVARDAWGRYAAGSVLALEAAAMPLRRGIAGVVEGSLPIGGLSSSAAVTLAYLLALEWANGLEVEPSRNIRLEQYVENVHIGLNNGILDQSVILLSRSGRLLVLDCLDERWELIAPHGGAPPFGIVVAYSGVSAALTSTGYNQRVAECEQAAGELLRRAGLPVAERPRLRHVPGEAYEAHAHELPAHLAKRARHFFTENARVIAGREAWEEGDLARFGGLVNESGRSSIDNYECGSPPLITLYETLRSVDGVYGARFSGAGFRGSCIGLHAPGCEDAVRGAVAGAFPSAHPDLADRYELHFCNSDDGAVLL
jgi:galacturonokinase